MNSLTSFLRKVLVLFIFCLAFPLQAQDSDYRLLVFEGSDWCANCRRLEKKVLSKAQIQDYFEQHGVTVQKVDFPQRKKLADSILQQNKALAERYGFKGEFPTLLLVNSSSDQSQRIPYRNQNPQEFIALVQSAIQKNP